MSTLLETTRPSVEGPKKGYRYRIYPSDEQKVLLNSYIGADCQPALNDLSDSEKQALQEEYRALRKKLANR